MRKIKLYIAVSLNGKIARNDGSVDWLESIPNPDKTDYGYSEFYDSVDTTIQGYSTYAQVLSWGIEFPYKEKKNYVITRRQDLQETEYVEFISNNHIDFVRKLKEMDGNDIWLIGGGQINTMLFNEKLIDELQLYIMPVVIPEGIEIFEILPEETPLSLIDTETFTNGVVKLKYELTNYSK